MDKLLNIPFDVTFTKLDNLEGKFAYNFYKVQLFSVNKKYCLLVRWGEVGTLGNIKRMFYDVQEDGIDSFKQIYSYKTGENWTQMNFFNNQKMLQCFPNIINHYNPGHKRCIFKEFLHKLLSSFCSINTDFKSLILKYINSILELENERKFIFENLSTKSLEHGFDILTQLSKLIIGNDNLNSNLKIFDEMIDLSEQFYACVKIFGNEFDQLKPILNIDEIREKSSLIRKLKSIVFSMEFLLLAMNKKMNPWDYLNSSFLWNCQLLLAKNEIDFIKHYFQIFISEIIDENRLNIFKINLNQNHQSHIFNRSASYKRYLLWYHLKNYQFLEFFINGFKNEFHFEPDFQMIINVWNI